MAEMTGRGGTTGDATTISVVHLSAGDGVIDDETWIVQAHDNTGDCGAYDACWIEAGYANKGSDEFFYWADVRPCSCGGYHEFDSAALQSGDYSYVNIGIYRTSSSTWAVNVFGADTSLSGTSTGQTYSPSDILIGQELGGTSGANAPEAYFTSNEWRDGGANWHEQAVNGQLDPCFNGVCTNNNPPWSGWVRGENPPNYLGGNFYTYTT